MNKLEELKKLNELNLMFNGCGDFEICYMGIIGEKEVFKISRELKIGKRVNWVKIKNILNKNNIRFIKGYGDEGKTFSKNIDMYF
jgi:hypothetical protein